MTESDVLIERPSSRLRREIRDGQAVYFKEYCEGERGRTSEVIRARAAREADLLGRLAASGRFHGRLGVPSVIASDPQSATIVTAEVPGKTLESFLVGSYRQRVSSECLRALWLAGRWLRTFETTAVCVGDEVNISPHEPRDLVEYCAVRLRNIGEAMPRCLHVQQVATVECRLREWLAVTPENERAGVWCHGDFAPVNILWDSRRLTTIDFAMARVDLPLVDATYFLHRLEMLAVYFPWKRWPIAAWKRAFLKGYGRQNIDRSPLWQAQQMRHLLCRVQTYVRRPTKGIKQSLHRAWILQCLRRRLAQALVQHPADVGHGKIEHHR